jgi:hypothetical protein
VRLLRIVVNNEVRDVPDNLSLQELIGRLMLPAEALFAEPSGHGQHCRKLIELR